MESVWVAFLAFLACLIFCVIGCLLALALGTALSAFAFVVGRGFALLRQMGRHWQGLSAELRALVVGWCGVAMSGGLGAAHYLGILSAPETVALGAILTAAALYACSEGLGTGGICVSRRHH